jgi:hypothetical protein
VSLPADPKDAVASEVGAVMGAVMGAASRTPMLGRKGEGRSGIRGIAMQIEVWFVKRRELDHVVGY